MRNLTLEEVKTVAGASHQEDEPRYENEISTGDDDSRGGGGLKDFGNGLISAGKSAALVGAGLTLADGPLPIGDIFGVPTFFAGGSLAAVGGLFVGAGELVEKHSGN